MHTQPCVAGVLCRVFALPALISILFATGRGGGSFSSPVPPLNSLAPFTIGGAVSSLTGTGLVLQNKGRDNLAVSANGPFTFSTKLAQQATYSVTVSTQPYGQICIVQNEYGAVASANVTNVMILCMKARRETLHQITKGDFFLGHEEYEDAIAAYEEGLRVDPSNTLLQQKLHFAIKSCQKVKSILYESLNCGSSSPVVKLIPSGDFARWTRPVTYGQILPDHNIEGGLKPIRSLTVPPLEGVPPRAFVVFTIGIDQNGIVTPGRRMADENGLAPQVMEAAKGWKFEPPTVNGSPVSTSTQVLVMF